MSKININNLDDYLNDDEAPYREPKKKKVKKFKDQDEKGQKPIKKEQK